MPTCYRHPSRETGVSCSNCGRPICPDCMTPTNVGMRCPECSRQRTRVVTMRSMSTEPRVTYALIAMNIVAFLAEDRFSVASGAGGGNNVYLKGALLGSNPALPGQGVAHGQWWRIVTSGFLHANFIHIALNMYLLYLLGRLLEPLIGSLKFAIVYFVSLLAGSFGALLVDPHTLTVGASGAVFGLMGAGVIELRSRGVGVMESQLAGLIAINLVLSFAISGISWGGHVGGLIGGTLAMVALDLGVRRRAQALAYVACAALAAASVAGSIATSHSSEVSAAAPQIGLPAGP